MTSRQIIAAFDSQSAAQAARDSLLELGLDRERVSIVDRGSGEPASARGDGQHHGFWAGIKDMFMPDEDRAALDEGIRRGAFVLSAAVPDDRADEAITRVERAGAIDLEQREAQWRAQGSQGASTSPARSTSAPGSSTGRTASSRTASGPASTTSPRTARGDTGQSETIPVVEERLRVGKREVNRGGVRVRSYIVEEPVHEEVKLRDEHVEIERRPVQKSAHPVPKGSPQDLMQERTIEVTETSEEPVVSREAVVTEEVQVRKSADERIEEIDDTVRRTKVDVEDSRKTTPSRQGKGPPVPPSTSRH